MSKWPIRNKMLLGLALLLVIVTALSGSGFIGLYAYRSTVKSLAWRINELPPASQLSRHVSDLRMSLASLHTWSGFPESDKQRPVSVELLRGEFHQNLRAVRETMDAYRRQLDVNDLNRVRLGDSRQERYTVREMDVVLERIATAVRDEAWIFGELKFGELKTDLEQLQDLADELPGYWHRNVQQFTDDVRGQYRALIVMSWVSTVLTALLLAVFVRLFYEWVFMPLRVLIEGSRKVASGDFDYRIHLRTDDEMAELARAMNGMTDRFQAIRDDLDRQVQERTKQVVRSEQLASVGFLAAGVAHEINNPLASIAMCSESLESRLVDILPQDEEHDVVRHYLGMIQTEAFRCKEITERLLDFSRMGEIKRQITPLRELVQNVIDMVEHLEKYQSKHMEFLDSPEVYASINPQEIKQVVLNLLTNALDSIEPDGLVRIELVESDGRVEMAFIDNGCGMSEEVLEHLFEPFFTQRRGGQGTGLGLSIAYRIVADHGGQIEASSDGPGKGSRLRVDFPTTPSHKEHENRHQAA